MNVAVILAGGLGTRFDASFSTRSDKTPKQFVALHGRPIIEYSIETFNNHPEIDEVAVVIHPDWRQRLEETLSHHSWTKLKKVINGGAERWLSTVNAVNAYAHYPDDTNLLLHDAARPLLPPDVISRVLKALDTDEAVCTAMPCTDTVWMVDDDGVNARPLERRRLRCAQTPQAFRLPLIREACRKALADTACGTIPTDDCSLVIKYMPTAKIAMVEGDQQNKKITTKADIA